MGLTEITNYIEDDFDDNALTSRSNASEGYFLHPSDNLISDVEGGDVLKAVYRPEWNSVQGTPSSSGGVLVLGSNGDIVATPSSHSTGVWQCDYQNQSIPSGGEFDMSLLAQNVQSLNGNSRPASCYFSQNGSASNSFFKVVSGSATELISSSYTPDTANHTDKVTRGSYGNFERFYDGTSIGTATDTSFTSGRHVALGQDFDATDIHVENYVVK